MIAPGLFGELVPALAAVRDDVVVGIEGGRQGDDAAAEAFAAQVRAIQRIRSRIEKRSSAHGSAATACAACDGAGSKASLQVRLTAIAYNLRRGLTLLVAA